MEFSKWCPSHYLLFLFVVWLRISRSYGGRNDIFERYEAGQVRSYLTVTSQADTAHLTALVTTATSAGQGWGTQLH
jgi:hypothetical protein